MKLLILLMILSVLMFACTAPSETSHEDSEMGNAGLVPADEKNVNIFAKDLSIEVEASDVNGNARGYLAKPKAPGNYPGVVMIHEWWGLNENIKDMARVLASEGYVVFAIDLYGEVTSDSARARELSGMVRENPGEAIEKMKSAVDYLKTEQNAESVGSLGWCFGGGQSLQLSLNEELDATVIYYGSLTDNRTQLMSIGNPVLGIFGNKDTSIPVASVQSFEKALDELGIENDIYIYDGVGHAFANPSGANYAVNETIDAWEKTVAFLNDNLKSSTRDKPESGEDIVMGEHPVDESVPLSEPVTVRKFVLTGENFRFLQDGEMNPDLVVKKGETVRIEFTSTSGFHDWVVDKFDASTERVIAGKSAVVEFVADETGVFEYYCSVGSHRANGMKGSLIVQ